MIRFMALAGLTLSLAACASHPPLAEASGPYRALNTGRWTATSDDLRGPRAHLMPADSSSLNSQPVSSPATTPEASS